MLMEAVPFERVWRSIYPGNGRRSSVIAFIRFLERKLGGSFVLDASRMPAERIEMLDLFDIAERLRERKVIHSYVHIHGMPDEPRFEEWVAVLDPQGKNLSGGIAIDERQALTAALAEATERQIWRTADDYFEHPIRATVSGMQNKAIIPPERFMGYSDAIRTSDPRFTLEKDASYLWVRCTSWTDKRQVYIPAQIISGKYGSAVFNFGGEPVIREPITTGLATATTKQGAVLSGALEIIERDAFMVAWLNQITPPRIDLERLGAQDKELSGILRQCAAYGIRLDAARLPTDAPAYAVCVVATDEQAHLPPRTVGLKAHRDIKAAVTGAALEALRMRTYVRKTARPAQAKPSKAIFHMERVAYWAEGTRYLKLDFLISGELSIPHEPWEEDDEETHLARIIAWCKEREYTFASVPLSRSRMNTTPWHIEMVVIPELIPLHQSESHPPQGGARRREAAIASGFTPRETPYTDEPHPFA